MSEETHKERLELLLEYLEQGRSSTYAPWRDFEKEEMLEIIGISSLQAENERLRESLAEMTEIVKAVRGIPDCEPCDPSGDLCGNTWCHEFGCIPAKFAAVSLALATMKEKE